MVKDNDQQIDRRTRSDRRWKKSRRQEVRWEPEKEDRRKLIDRRKENTVWEKV